MTATYSFIDLANDVGTFCRFERLNNDTGLSYIFPNVETVTDCLNYIARYMADDIKGDLVYGVCKLPMNNYCEFLKHLLDVSYDIEQADNDNNNPSVIVETLYNNIETDVTLVLNQFDEIVMLAKSGPLNLRRLNKAVKGVMVLSSKLSSYKSDVAHIKDRLSFISEHLDVTIGRTNHLEGVYDDIQKIVHLNNDVVAAFTTHMSNLNDRVSIQETRLFQLQSDHMNRHISNDTIVLRMCQFTMMLMGSLMVIGVYILM